MAHADYDCCAVCDCKLSYQGYCSAGTKDEICSRCVANLAECGIIVHNVDELVTWINESPDIIVKAVLVLVGFRKCYYQNRWMMLWCPEESDLLQIVIRS